MWRTGDFNGMAMLKEWLSSWVNSCRTIKVADPVQDEAKEIKGETARSNGKRDKDLARDRFSWKSLEVVQHIPDCKTELKP